ncbi:MAG: sigma-70 family RNA polymerase sigma factor [Ruminiclostridium sp.]
MTNEKLALLIAEGENDELIPLLWEKTRKLFRLWADNFYNRNKARCDLCGVTNDDLRQEGFFALLEAVKAYSNRPAEQKELKFSSFCHYPFKNRAAALIGRTKRQRNDPLNNSISLDQSIPGADETDAASLSDFLPDETAEQPFRAIENESFSAEVRRTVRQELSGSTALRIVEKRYCGGETYAQIAKDLDLTRSRIHQITDNALRRLRKSRPLQAHYYGGNPYRTVSATAQQRDGSIVEQIVEKKDELEQRRMKNHYESYFSQLSEAALKKDFELLTGLDVKQRKDNSAMYAALIAVMHRRKLLNS